LLRRNDKTKQVFLTAEAYQQCPAAQYSMFPYV